MERNVFDVLQERGFIKQATHEDEIRELLGKEKVTFYIGFDPTADSLHVGHFVQAIVMMHMQKAGHRPIVLLGGGTTMVGDPTGKTDMRKMMTKDTIQHNAECFKEQLSKFIDFSDGKAIMVNNADWLLNLNYIDFLREVGVHFSVNRMLTAECFKARMEKGLSFLEFNYMIMQGYDFLELYRKYNCRLQFGGDDQWSNIIAGADLIRRVESAPAFGMTFKLLTTSEGKKMGKTEAGAVWLNPEKTSPYDFYQYWRNVADADVENCLSLLTFLPMDEVKRLSSLEGAEINKAKEILAYEVTNLVHGKEEADKAQAAAKALFESGAMAGSIPTTSMPASEFDGGMDILELLVRTELAASKSEARRLVTQGGISVEGEKVADISFAVNSDSFTDGKIMIKKGKKVYHQVELA
ncbi:tyrosyl-tRNA synthetase [Peptoclostridium litorale DSM 5388]|uniref:Tyrosine--tRNA ligase n=1 Tax=Peptoclostridium litorale DSM 5388 TaxID=1121324 RepID=A0A069RI62_PEPLI|nr:tyrosine--tRNA ligase [Peptoclostridium litorale]KDR96681.1 tyrosine--tRNA ligase TyrS [Peptoclostridium litorale DSM 5388]SIN67783.1 tyrosyl-tRNA synthetase [Peptoclostridium litorale DSM 5388]